MNPNAVLMCEDVAQLYIAHMACMSPCIYYSELKVKQLIKSSIKSVMYALIVKIHVCYKAH